MPRKCWENSSREEEASTKCNKEYKCEVRPCVQGRNTEIKVESGKIEHALSHTDICKQGLKKGDSFISSDWSHDLSNAFFPPCDPLQYLLIWTSSKGPLKGMVVLLPWVYTWCVCVCVCVFSVCLKQDNARLKSQFPDLLSVLSLAAPYLMVHEQMCVCRARCPSSCIHLQKSGSVKPTSCLFLASRLPYILFWNT